MPAEFERPTNARVHIFYSEPEGQPRALQQSMQEAGTMVRGETMPWQTPWRENELMNLGSVPRVTLARVLEVLQ